MILLNFQSKPPPTRWFLILFNSKKSDSQILPAFKNGIQQEISTNTKAYLTKLNHWFYSQSSQLFRRTPF